MLDLFRTKRGLAGACLLFLGFVHGVFGLLQDVTYAASNGRAILAFLASGLGNMLVLIAGLLLILWTVLGWRAETEAANATLLGTETHRELAQSAEQRDVSDGVRRYEKWQETNLTVVADAKFVDEHVPLDGFAYDRCTFVRCTFVYKGEAPFHLDHFVVKEDFDILAGSPSVHYTVALLNALKVLLRNRIDVEEELEPVGKIAFGELNVPTPEGPQAAREKALAELERLRQFEQGFAEQLAITTELEGENQRLRELANRYLLALALREKRDDARFFQSSKPTYKRAEEWASHTFRLIESSLPDDKARYFDEVMRLGFHDEDPYAPPNTTPPNEQQALERAEQVLDKLIAWVNSRDCPRLKDGFDGREWVSDQ